MVLSDFYSSRSGTCLIVGNGKNLHLTPPDKFDYPAFGMNTIHLYEGWKPDFYTAVDSRVMREFGAQIAEKYRDIPKFIPTPNLDQWQGDNFYRFYHRPGPLWPRSGANMDAGFLSLPGITYGNVMHIAMQLAAWMGFTTLLIVGMEHKPAKGQDHFWGCDHGMTANPPIDDWLNGYSELVHGLGVEILNISADTYVPENVIPRADWRKYANQNVGILSR